MSYYISEVVYDMKAVAVDSQENKIIWMVQKRPKAFGWTFHLTMKYCTPVILVDLFEHVI